MKEKATERQITARQKITAAQIRIKYLPERKNLLEEKKKLSEPKKEDDCQYHSALNH